MINNRTIKSKNKKSKINYELIFLIVILAFGLFLRVYSLGKPVFWVDEATSAIAAKNIITNGQLEFDSGKNYGSYFLHYSVAGFFYLFGFNESSARVVSVIFGLLTILLFYFIGKQYSKSAGIIAALFSCVFYLEVFFSRQARYYQILQFFFFLSLYLLYLSFSYKEKKWLIYPALVAMFLAIDTHLQGLILAPFFLIYILIYYKQKWLAIFPAIPLIQKAYTAIKISTLSTGVNEATQNFVINNVSHYFSFASNIHYLLVLFIPGLIWAWIKNKKLTLILVLPSLFTLIGIISMKIFALRYSYFFIFPLILYSSLLLSFLYEKYGKILLIAIVAVLLIPSNLVYEQSYVNVIKPIDYNYADYTAPDTNYKLLSQDLIFDMKNNTLISFFSSDVEWYIKKPDYVIPFSLNGIGEDQVSVNNTNNEFVDIYSGAKILDYNLLPAIPYYITADSFSTSKLKPLQKANFDKLVENCTISYSNYDLKIYYCS